MGEQMEEEVMVFNSYSKCSLEPLETGVSAQVVFTVVQWPYHQHPQCLISSFVQVV